MARGQVVAGHRQDRCVGAGGQHQGVVAMPLPCPRATDLVARSIWVTPAVTAEPAEVTGVIVAGKANRARSQLGMGRQADPVAQAHRPRPAQVPRVRPRAHRFDETDGPPCVADRRLNEPRQARAGFPSRQAWSEV